MNVEQPLVSIILPVYNAAQYIEEAINSCLTQSYKNLELIIINDSSTDDTPMIIKKYINDSRVILIENEVNLRLILSLNKGLALAKGKYIARMDADDICNVERLAKQVDFLESNPQTVLVGASYEVFGSKNRIIKAPITDSGCRAALLTYSPFCHPLVMFRAEIVKSNNINYSLDYLHAEDYKFFVELSKHGKVGNLDDVLLKYRYHSEQISQQFSGVQLNCRKKIILENDGVFKEHLMASLFEKSIKLTKEDKKFFFKGYLELLLADHSPLSLKRYLTIFSQARTTDVLKFLIKLVIQRSKL
jgi:glycosyltransferase involved in cell wall biosynthesis